MKVYVRDGDAEQALRALKKKLQRGGLFREMKMRTFFEKPSQERVRRRKESIRRSRKVNSRKKTV